MSPTARRLRQPWRLLVLVASVTIRLIVANARVAWDVITPALLLRPAVVRVPARRELGDVGLVILANLISVTPGTLTLEVDGDARDLYVHVMYPGSRAEVLADLDRLQVRLIKALYAVDPVDGDRRPAQVAS
jgi:multicomponent Na+:H+ antiporter subunit E